MLTTHAGSLPRADDVEQMRYDLLDGKPVDSEAFDARVRAAMAEIVKHPGTPAQVQLLYPGMAVAPDPEVDRDRALASAVVGGVEQRVIRLAS